MSETNPIPTKQGETLEQRMRAWPQDLIAVHWAETLSEGEQSTLLTSSIRRLQQAINVAATSSPAPAAPSVADAIQEVRDMQRDWEREARNSVWWQRYVDAATYIIGRLESLAPAKRTRVEGEQEDDDDKPQTLAQRMAAHNHVDIVPGVLGGVNPLVSRTRISVHSILTYLHNGDSIEHIAKTYNLTPEAIKDAIAFAQDVYDDAIDSALRYRAAAPADNDAESLLPELTAVFVTNAIRVHTLSNHGCKWHDCVFPVCRSNKELIRLVRGEQPTTTKEHR